MGIEDRITQRNQRIGVLKDSLDGMEIFLGAHEELEQLTSENYQDYMTLLEEELDQRYGDRQMRAAYPFAGWDYMPAGTIDADWTYISKGQQESLYEEEQIEINGNSVTQLDQNLFAEWPDTGYDFDVILLKTPGSMFDDGLMSRRGAFHFYQSVANQLTDDGVLVTDRDPTPPFVEHTTLEPAPVWVSGEVADPYGGSASGTNPKQLSVYEKQPEEFQDHELTEEHYDPTTDFGSSEDISNIETLIDAVEVDSEEYESDFDEAVENIDRFRK